MSLGGEGHVELIEGFFGLTDYPLMCECRSSSWLLVFVLIWFPSMVEIQIMCDTSMDDTGIHMIVTMLK